MSKKLLATKRYAAPVSKWCFRQKYPSKAFRRIYRADAIKVRKAKIRKSKRHPPPKDAPKGTVGLPMRPLTFKSTREQTHATGALKRSERHPSRGTRARRVDLAWKYVSR